MAKTQLPDNTQIVFAAIACALNGKKLKKCRRPLATQFHFCNQWIDFGIAAGEPPGISKSETLLLLSIRLFVPSFSHGTRVATDGRNETDSSYGRPSARG